MIDVSAWVRRLMFAITVAALTLAGWTLYENHTLISTNAELAHYITTKLDSLEADVRALRASSVGLREALRGGRLVVADSILRADK